MLRQDTPNKNKSVISFHEQFAHIAEWLYEQSGIEIPVDRLDFDIYENKRGGNLALRGSIIGVDLPAANTTFRRSSSISPRTKS